MRLAADGQMRRCSHELAGGLSSHIRMRAVAGGISARRPAVALAMLLGVTAPFVPAMAQPVPAVSPSLPPPLPSAPGTGPANVEVDPDRVFGDDESPDFSPLALLGGFGVGISGSLITKYSDNVARIEDGEPLRIGLESKDDWSFRPTMDISAQRPLGQQALFLNASIGKTFYVQNTLLNRAYLSADGGLQWRLGIRCAGVVQGGWRDRGTQFATFDDVVPSSTETFHFTASASCPTAGGLTPNLAYTYYSAKSRVDDEFAGVLDRSFADVRSHGISGGVGYRLSTRGEVGVQAQWRRSSYPNQFLPGGEENYNIINGFNGFVKYRLGRSLSANGTLGYTKVKRPEILGDGFSGAVWSLGLNYTGPRIGASITGGRSVNGSSGGNANYSVAKHLAANLSYRMNSRLSASAGAIWRNANMSGLYYVPGTQNVDVRKLDRYFVGADYRMNRILAFSLDFNHQRMRTEPAGFGYKENSVRLAIRASM